MFSSTIYGEIFICKQFQEKYSKFKDKFEKLDDTLAENLEDRLKQMEREIAGLGKETLASAKEK